MRRTALAACLLGLVLPGQALAGTATVRDDRDPRSGEIHQFVSYAAARGERNDLTIAARASEVEFRDSAGVTPGRQCSRPDPADRTRVICRSNQEGDFNGFASATLGNGNDVVRVSEGSATIDAGSGNDRVLGGSGSGNSITGGPGNDVLTGGPGSDIFDEGERSSGSDTIHGGRGSDQVDYSLRSAPLRVSLDGRRNDGARHERDLVGTDVENVDAGTGDDRLVGNGADNTLQGAAGSDVVSGRGGDDAVDAGRGDPVGAPPAHSRDRVSGGSGDDVLFSAGRGTRLDGGRGHDDFIGSDGGDRILARDRESDSISCYRGRDLVVADSHDFVAGGSDVGRCERIHRRGRATAVAVGLPFANDPGPLAVDTAGVTSFSVACPVDGPRVCRGTVTAAMNGVALGSLPFRVGRGHSDERTFTVPASERARVLASPRLRLTATIRSVRERFAVRLLQPPP